jgi:F-type H+-transporting ATPase subunit a
VVSFLVSRAYRRAAPGTAQNVLEVFVDFLRDLIKENIPHHGERYLPIAGAFFFFIFLCNLCGLFFFLQPPTANLNVTFALSITCFFFFNGAGIREHGLFGYLKHFLGPMLALAPLMFLIEMIGNFARALSLSMRLYGNIFGEHTASSIFSSLVPIVVPWPMMALGIFTALLQAYVFTLLTTVYLGGATAHEH